MLYFIDMYIFDISTHRGSITFQNAKI